MVMVLVLVVWLLDMSPNPQLSLPLFAAMWMPTWGRVGSDCDELTLSPGLSGSSFHQIVSSLVLMTFH